MGGWLTDWRTLIPQKFTHWTEGSEPHVRLPNLGDRRREEEFLENQTLKPSGNWLQDFDRTGGNRDTTLGEHTQSSVHIRTQRKEQWPQERLNQTYMLVLEGLLQRRGGGPVAHRGDKDTGSRSSPQCEPSQSLSLAHQRAQVGSSVGFPQAKQPTGREPSPTHQQSSGLKFY